jgi:predicted nuclease of predicted toxin-antitoxin system
MARFYANEQFSFPTVNHLRSLGHDVLTTSEAGQSNQGIPDPEVLAFAQAQRRAVLTLNRKDFIRLHRQVPDHPASSSARTTR